MFHLSRTMRLGAALGLALVVGLTTAPSAAAKAPPKIVQLGDSYSAGNGAGGYIERTCWRSDGNYGAQVASQLGAKYTNVACSGGVVADLLTPRRLSGSTSAPATYTIDPATYPDQLAEWVRLARRDQLCGVPAQSDFYYTYAATSPVVVGDQVTARAACELFARAQIDAVNPSTDMVFVTVGGNDIGFSTIVLQCLGLRSPAGCRTAITTATAKAGQMKQATKAAALAVHKKSKGRADLYLLGYPYLLNTADYSIPEAAPTYNFGAGLHGLQAYGDELQAEGMAELNVVVGDDDFHFVDVKPEWGGHAHGLDPHIVADQSQSWIVPISGSHQLPEWVHPAPEGWSASARALLDAIQS